MNGRMRVKRVVALSNTLTKAPDELVGKIELYSGPLPELTSKLASEGCQRLYIDGGKTIQSFINESLITDMTITTIPILLGEGLPLFGSTPHDIKLKHISTQSFSNGFVHSTYEVEHVITNQGLFENSDEKRCSFARM